VQAEPEATDPDTLRLAGEYGDLIAMQHDLAFVGAAARRFAALSNEGDEGGVLHRAFWSSAVIAYRRCFRNGRGHGLIQRPRLLLPDAVVETLEPRLKEMHAKALAEANKHFAHRVNAELSQMPIHLISQQDGASRNVIGVMAVQFAYLGPVTEEANLLGDLADRLGTRLAKMVDGKKEELISRAQSVYDSEQKQLDQHADP
jgi:hypothetical protein